MTINAIAKPFIFHASPFLTFRCLTARLLVQGAYLMKLCGSALGPFFIFDILCKICIVIEQWYPAFAGQRSLVDAVGQPCRMPFFMSIELLQVFFDPARISTGNGIPLFSCLTFLFYMLFFLHKRLSSCGAAVPSPRDRMWCPRVSFLFATLLTRRGSSDRLCSQGAYLIKLYSSTLGPFSFAIFSFFASSWRPLARRPCL